MTRALRLLSLAAWLAAGTARGESLYDPAAFTPLTADRKAYRVGDVITVQVVETSSASTSTDTSTQRKHNLSAAFTATGSPGTKQVGVTGAVSGDFQGGGTTQRADKLLATVTVTVREVLPSGDLRIAGEQLLTVNEEQTKVQVEGRIRPVDVSTDDVVLSTRLADARITYVGNGDLSMRQHRPWWRKLVDWLGF